VHDAGKAKMDISSYLKLHHQFVPKKKRKEKNMNYSISRFMHLKVASVPEIRTTPTSENQSSVLHVILRMCGCATAKQTFIPKLSEPLPDRLAILVVRTYVLYTQDQYTGMLFDSVVCLTGL
jgi:hypothetical protein